jgi:lipooligosaccharide transport system permease protein
MNELRDFILVAKTILRRNFLVNYSNKWTTLANNLGNPILFLFAFGYGLGAIIDEMGDVPYIAFVVPGMIAYATMFTSSFEATIGAFSRFQFLRTWDAALATPVRLHQLLMAEIVWGALKGVFAGFCVLLVGTAVGGIVIFSKLWLLLPICLLASACFMACGLVATAYARWYDSFSYFFTFWVSPMFMFCGVFFSVDRFPEWLQWVSFLLPMTPFIGMIRPLTTGLPIDWVQMALQGLYLVGLTMFAFWIAHRKIKKRMFD